MPEELRPKDLYEFKPYTENYGKYKKGLGAYNPEKRGKCKNVSYFSDISEEQAIHKRTPLDDLIEIESLQKIEHQLNSLSDEHKKIIMLRVFDEKTITEVATELGMSRSTVHFKLNQALERFINIGTYSVLGVLGIVIITGGRNSHFLTLLNNSLWISSAVLFSLLLFVFLVVLTPVAFSWLKEKRKKSPNKKKYEPANASPIHNAKIIAREVLQKFADGDMEGLAKFQKEIKSKVNKEL